MQANFQFHLTGIQSETLTKNMLFTSSTMPLPKAKAQRYNTDKGDFIVQSLDHYLADLILIESSLIAGATVKYSVAKTAFLLFADLGQNSCKLCYRPIGEYELNLLAGKTQLLCLAFNPEWLLYKSQHLPALSSFTNSFSKAGHLHYELPSFEIATNLFRSLKKVARSLDDLTMDACCYGFINECLNKYNYKLIGENRINKFYEEKAIALADFIKENFATPLVDDMPALAGRFLVSERTMTRLAKIAFGIPLHEQVINTRMAFAFSQLSTTDKAIYEIARLSGYNEANYFSKAFKKYYGHPPKAVERPVKLLLTV